jgi:hypothetical protein
VASIPAAATESVVCNPSGPDKTICRIVEPNVKRPTEPFPRVAYKPGDDVIIDAGGCAQTGGFGRTWKRYVNPFGANADRLYHGLIFVPGANSGFERIGTNHRVFHVSPAINPSLTFVRLGYEDDNYSDNGYWGHDDGNNDQCKNSVNAFVTVTIVHHPGTPAPVAHRPLDAVNTSFDDNGLFFAPRWFYENGGVLKSTADICPGGDPVRCTLQAVGLDAPSFPKSPGFCSGGKGHVNWLTATFTGKVFWDSHAWSDDDYNMWLVGASSQLSEPMTSANNGPPGHGSGVQLEFDSDETVDHFSSAWWNGFHQAVDDSDDKARAKVDNADAVAVGLLGLDCVHDCATEVHPVLALAMRVNDHPAGIDRWSFFVRNRGDEGFCSQNAHVLPVPTIVLRLHPPATGLHHVTIVDRNLFHNDPRATVTFDQDGSDLIVIATVPDQDREEHVDGSIDLRWTP